MTAESLLNLNGNFNKNYKDKTHPIPRGLYDWFPVEMFYGGRKLKTHDFG